MSIARTQGRIRGRLLLAAFLACLMVAGARADDWRQYNGNSGDRTSTETIGTITWSQASPPTPIWEITTANGFSSFSVADGKAFTLESRLHTGVLHEFCVAYRASDGEQLWASPLTGAGPYDGGGDEGGGGDGPRSTPTCDGERVYVLDCRLNLYCFNDETGAEDWSKNIVADYGGRNISWQNAASPLLAGELVVLAGGGATQSFLAFNRTNGALAWATNVDQRMTHASPVAATIHDVPQIIFFARSGLFAVRASDGIELWRQAFPYSTSTAASPVVCGNYVYCSAGYNVGAGLYEITKPGATFIPVQIWRKPNQLENQWMTPVFYNGYVYGLYGQKDYGTAPLMCVEMITGDVEWSQPGFGMGNLMRVGDKLVVLAENGNVVIVEATPTAYTEITRADMLAGKCWSSPVLSDNRIYARSTTNGVCFELSNLVSPPTITAQPDDATTNPAQTAIFRIEALDAVGYQWLDDGVALSNGGRISGAISNTLTIGGVIEADQGQYSCVASNAGGPTTSTAATLTVNDAPVVVQQGPFNLLPGTSRTLTLAIVTDDEPDKSAYVTSVTNAGGLSITSGSVSVSGTVSYHIDATGFALDQTFPDILLTATDPLGLSGSTIFTVTLSGGNTNPNVVAVNVGALAVGGSTPDVVIGQASDAEDALNALILSIQINPSGLSFDNLEVDVAGVLTADITAPAGEPLGETSPITLQVLDSGGLNGTDTFTVTLVLEEPTPVRHWEIFE
ncbi:PQQ-binding-like beta-propeller repeat protein [Candidatus Sumerlaeota bacterium]